MWSKSHRQTVKGITATQVWKVWADINQWHTWQGDIEYATLTGDFKAGNTFCLKPKGGPRVSIELMKVEPNLAFVDLTRFPLARMYGEHIFIQRGDELDITTTVSIEGPLSLLWRKIVAEDVAAGMEAQTRGLIEKARHV